MTSKEINGLQYLRKPIHPKKEDLMNTLWRIAPLSVALLALKEEDLPKEIHLLTEDHQWKEAKVPSILQPQKSPHKRKTYKSQQKKELEAKIMVHSQIANLLLQLQFQCWTHSWSKMLTKVLTNIITKWKRERDKTIIQLLLLLKVLAKFNVTTERSRERNQLQEMVTQEQCLEIYS